MRDRTTSRREELQRRLAELVPEPGVLQTELPGLELMRADGPRPRVPVVYHSCVCFVAQGSKKVYLDGDAYTLERKISRLPWIVDETIPEGERDSTCTATHGRASKKVETQSTG